MSLLRLLTERVGQPAVNHAQSIQNGGGMPPMRGYMAWNSGFEGTQKQMLEELLRAMELRQNGPGTNPKRMLPMLKG